jgi:hypothetical protein
MMFDSVYHNMSAYIKVILRSIKRSERNVLESQAIQSVNAFAILFCITVHVYCNVCRCSAVAVLVCILACIFFLPFFSLSTLVF